MRFRFKFLRFWKDPESEIFRAKVVFCMLIELRAHALSIAGIEVLRTDPEQILIVKAAEDYRRSRDR
ncbi:hypothetical protein DK847_08545 [Aestuariivirga litoralis]|uniref:Uncharacterized protein n=1 Tax=Aestuariivirga litoralis TaxID=2650924 RepID=A0A2W2AXK6_9HYPH|nr:hypothetical protein DK847_08545 [Aestuariivirga litoralis]